MFELIVILLGIRRPNLTLERFGTIELNLPVIVTLTSSPATIVVFNVSTCVTVTVTFAGVPSSLMHKFLVVIEAHVFSITLFPENVQALPDQLQGVSGIPESVRVGSTIATLTPTRAALFSWFLSHHALEISAIPKKITKSNKSTNTVSMIAWPFCQYFSVLVFNKVVLIKFK